jgi:CRISPR type I-E-associated protein CasB/Cse2
MSHIGDKAFIWWESIQENTGAKARLRRCTTPLEAGLEPVVVKLRSMIGCNTYNIDRIATIAGVLACVKSNTCASSVAAQIGTPQDHPLYSPLRLKRLFAVETEEDSLRMFRRLVAMAGNSLDVKDLADSIYDWTDENRGIKRRRDWSLQYYGG